MQLDVEQLAPETIRPIMRAEYDRMVAMGLFEGERIELLHGMLVAMSPQGTPHAEAVRRLTEQLLPALLGRARTQCQLPFAAADDSEPEPDLAIIPLGDYLVDHPTQALLAIEVSESSLRKDRGIKTALYAAAGVTEYWIVNLVDRVIEVHREPQGGAYESTRSYGPGEAIALVTFPDVRIEVDAVLP